MAVDSRLNHRDATACRSSSRCSTETTGTTAYPSGSGSLVDRSSTSTIISWLLNGSDATNMRSSIHEMDDALLLTAVGRRVHRAWIPSRILTRTSYGRVAAARRRSCASMTVARRYHILGDW